MATLTAERTQDLKDAFHTLSAKADKLSVSKVPDLLRAIGYAPSRADEGKIAAFAGTPDVDFEGFLNILKNIDKLLSGVNDLFESLIEFERTSANGVFTLKDLKYVVKDTGLGETLTDAEWTALVDALQIKDVKEDSPIRVQELVRALTSIKRF